MRNVGEHVLFDVQLLSTVAERYVRVFRSRFAVRRHLCLAFFVRASRFSVRTSRFAVRSHLCLAFFVRASRFAARSHLYGSRERHLRVRVRGNVHVRVRGSRFLIRGSYFLVHASQFAVRSWWFVVRAGWGSIYHRLFLRPKCAEQSECPVRVTVDGMF